MSKIFIVDDDIFITRMYERAFRFANHETEIAYDGTEALLRLETMNPLPDIVALDAIMPKMNGLEVLQEIRSTERLKNIPVVILTNSIKKEDAEEFLKLGASFFLIKMDQDSREIVRKIEEIIKANESNIKKV
ncbi:MAG: response regulator [Patescibacteria group bacterium]